MIKKKKLFITCCIIILILIIGAVAYVEAATKSHSHSTGVWRSYDSKNRSSAADTVKDLGDEITLCGFCMGFKYNDMYCVEHNHRFDGLLSNNGDATVIYKCTGVAQIRGDTVTITTSSGTKTITDSSGTSRKLAAVYALDEFEYGYAEDAKAVYDGAGGGNDGIAKSRYTYAQLATYYLWNTWLSNTSAGFDSNSSNKISGQEGYRKMKSMLDEIDLTKEYCADIYFIEYQPRNKNEAEKFEDLIQDLIIANGWVTTDTTVQVTKKWNDGGETANRPESIKIRLYANGTECDTVTLPNDKMTTTASGNWVYKFEGLDVNDASGNKIEYTISEDAVGNGYTTTITERTENKFVITNKLRTKVTVNKIWRDSGKSSRPSTIKLRLWKVSLTETTTIKIDDTEETYPLAQLVDVENFTVTDDNKYTFSNLSPIDTSNFKFAVSEGTPTNYIQVTGDRYYVINEATGVRNYVVDVSSGNLKNGYTATLTNSITTTVKVDKVWDDANNRDLKRPDTINIRLWRDNGNGTASNIKTEKISSANGWSYTFENVAAYDANGNAFKYAVSEDVGLDDNGAKDIPYYTQYTNIEDSNKKNITSTKGRKATIVGVSGSVSAGYTCTIENQHIPEEVEIIIQKVWEDDNNRDGLRPNTLKFKLKANGKEATYKNGTEVGEITLSATDSNIWQTSIGDLYKTENGSDINYTLEEVTEINGYETSITVDKNTKVYTYIVTNTHEPELVKIPVTKKWDDDKNRDGKRPTTIKLTLFANDKEVMNHSLSGSNTDETWSYTFESTNNVKLYKYENGELINYKIKEEAIDATLKYEEPKYTTSSSSENNASTTCGSIKGTATKGSPETLSGFTIINKHIPEKVGIIVKKIWDDDNNRDGWRTSSVTFTLKANGNNVTADADGKTITNPVTLSNTNNWYYEYTNLYRYENGKEIDYTIEENTTPTYYTKGEMIKTTSTSSGTQVITLSITNKHELELVEIPVTKIWDDDTDRDGLRPESITIDLLDEDGKIVDTITISGSKESNTWTGKFPSSENVKLYKYKEGKVGELKTYKIQERTITERKEYYQKDEYAYEQPKYTTSSSSGNVTTASTTSGNISGTKDYHDSNNNGKAQTLSGFTVINRHTPEKIEVTITKVWDDVDDLDEYRPDSVTFTLLSNENGSSSRAQYAADSSSTRSNVGDITITDPIKSGDKYTDRWGAEKVSNLYRYHNHGKAIEYTVEEKSIANYNEEDAYPRIDIIDCDKDGKPAASKVVEITVTNKHTPNYEGYIEITGKVWNDGQAGKGNDINGTYGTEDKLIEGIKVKLKDSSGNSSIKASYYKGSGQNIVYCGTEYAETAADGTYTIRVNYDDSDASGNVYKLYENSAKVRTEVNSAYVEFEYNGMKYTTVKTSNSGENTSKAIEYEGQSVNDEKSRKRFDNQYSTVTPSTQTTNLDNASITASTQSVISFETYGDKENTNREEIIKYCYGDKYNRTNPENNTQVLTNQTKYLSQTEHPGQKPCNGNHVMSKYGVQVEIIQNVNLGLFEREQPDVAIFADLTKVDVEMNNQSYSYLYGIRNTNPSTSEELQVKFQNKGTYTYRRPVNPADVAYLEQENPNAMNVYVTYEVKVANLSTTLQMNVDSIINVYDSEYEDSISITKKGGSTVTYTPSGNYGTFTAFKEITLNNLNINLAPQTQAKEEDTIVIRYKVRQDKLLDLFYDDKAPLNIGVEIHTYSTKYGADTLYAEQRTGGRTDNPYGGYDQYSKPGNAYVEVRKDDNSVDRLKSTESIALNDNIVDPPENDTDFAPSFVLCKDNELKTLSGTIWEDTDENPNDGEDGKNAERLGNGKDDGTAEARVKNMKIELYNLDGTLATLYDASGNPKEAKQWSGDDGSYAFEGLVTGEYFVKFTYGDDEAELGHDATTMDGETKVNARNYKSTIITDQTVVDSDLEPDTKFKDIFAKTYVKEPTNDPNAFTEKEKMWHITHADGYSIAVDNMLDRLSIKDLQYNNFYNTENMTAYSKPFKSQVEFEETGESQVKDENGDIDAPTNLNKMDFGIIERPREDLFVQKVVSYVKVTLANGQILTEGDPRDKTQNLPYVKYMAPIQDVTNGEYAGSSSGKQLLIEMDEELIQGGKLEVEYEVQVTNNNEVDYDYGDASAYTDIDINIPEDDSVPNKYDIYISKSPKANYYYYGNKEGLNELGTTIEFVDYMNKDIVYKANGAWEAVEYEVLEDIIDEAAYKTIKDNQYSAFSSSSGMSVTIPRGRTTDPIKMLASKLLAIKDENQYDNSAEILKIDAKTARTIKESENGKQIEKAYIPGNYDPVFHEEKNEQDDDRVDVIISPPTGIVTYIITYAVAGLIGLAVISIGIIFIKKKVLIK